MAVNKSADLLFNSMSIFGKGLNIAQPTNSKPSNCRPCLLLRKCTVNDPFRMHLFSSTRPADCCPSNKMETKSHLLHKYWFIARNLEVLWLILCAKWWCLVSFGKYIYGVPNEFNLLMNQSRDNRCIVSLMHFSMMWNCQNAKMHIFSAGAEKRC